jgi:hypothetical protein
MFYGSFCGSVATSYVLLKEDTNMPKNNHSEQTDSAVLEIRNYPVSLIHEHISSEDKSVFYSLSFRWKDSWASLWIPKDAISQSLMRNGKPIEGRLNITLGDPEQIRSVSIMSDDSSGYKRKPLYNRSILSAIRASKESYLRAIAE